ncbi:MAG TPA: YncE family protein [Acidobacteriota bacterium]|nr:YncE family protein [Acidobacteriota bacterium]
MMRRIAIGLLAMAALTCLAPAANLTQVDEIKTRKAPLYAAIHTPSGTVYITCFADSDVVVMKEASRQADTKFYGGYEPVGIAVTPSGDKIFVTNRKGLVKVIDTQSHQIVDDIKVGGRPSNITMSPGGLIAFVTNFGRGKIGRIDFIDTSSHRIVGSRDVGIAPMAAAVSPLGDRLFVACAGSNEIWVINSNTREVIKQIPVGLKPNGLAFSKDGATLYVSNADTNDLSVIDVLDLRETRRVPVGEKPFSMTVDSQGRLFVVESGQGMLSLYSPELQRLASVKAGKKPIDVELSSDEQFAYVTDERANKVRVFKID